MCEKRVTFSLSEPKPSIIHRKENINNKNHNDSDLTKRNSSKRSVLMKQCKTQPLSKTDNVKKSFVRNFEQAVSKKTIVSEAFKEKVPMYGVLEDGNLNYSNTRYASPELYSTLCVAKRMQQASEKNNHSKDVMVHSCTDDTRKADMGAALKLASPVVKNDVAKRLDFPPDEQLYMDLVALDLCDPGEMDPVIKSKCSLRKHSKKEKKKKKKEVVDGKEPSNQHVCTPECNVVFNFYAKSLPRSPSPVRFREYPMYSATDALKDSMRGMIYRRQEMAKLWKDNFSFKGCELCKDRDINDPGVFELNTKCLKCMYPSVDLSNDWFTQLCKARSNKSESNISTSYKLPKNLETTEINPFSSSSCASTCFGTTNSSRSKGSTLPNSSLMEAGSNYTDRDYGSNYKGIYNSRKSSSKSQRTETGNNGGTSMLKTYCDGKISEKSQHLESTRNKDNSGIIQDNDDSNILKTYSYETNSERPVRIENEANYIGENDSDNVIRGNSIHNDNKYSRKFQKPVVVDGCFDTDDHRSNDVAGTFKDTQGAGTIYRKCKIGGISGAGISKTNPNDTFSVKSEGQTEYRKYNIGARHSRDDTGIFKSNYGKLSVHSEGTEADYRTFKPIKVCGNDATGVCKYSAKFQGTEVVSDHRSSVTGDVYGTDNTGLLITYSDKLSTEGQGTELVSNKRANEPDRVCVSSGSGLFNNYTGGKFCTNPPGVRAVSNYIYRQRKSFSRGGRIDSTSGYNINPVDTSHGYGFPDHKQYEVPTNSSETSSKSQISEDISNDWLSSNNSGFCISSNSSDQTCRNIIDSYDVDTHVDSLESRSTFADIVSRYSEYGAPWYYGRSQAFTKLLKGRVGEWTSSRTQFCCSASPDNRNLISGIVIRHEAEEENSEKSESGCSEEQC